MYQQFIDFIPDDPDPNDPPDLPPPVQGWLCLRTESPELDEPILCRNYFPIMRTHKKLYEDFIGARAFNYAPGLYAAYVDNKQYTPTLFELREGGGTRPIRTERQPIPAPKRCKETRWNCGKWEKRTKKGWQAVGSEYPTTTNELFATKATR